MKQFIKLILSENLKIYSRRSTLMMVAALLFLVFLSAPVNWKTGMELGQSIWGLVAGQISALYVITIFTVIIAGGIVANEYSWGTIKLLLIRPNSRGRILLAKFLAIALFGLLMMGILFIAALTVNGLLIAVNGDLINPSVFHSRLWFDSLGGALLLYALRFADVLIYGTFALMLSTVSKSTALTLGVSLLTILFGPEVTNMINKPWAKYLFFANLDLARYLKGNPPPWPGMSLGFSITILTVYGIIFYQISRAFFVKRDVLE